MPLSFIHVTSPGPASVGRTDFIPSLSIRIQVVVDILLEAGLCNERDLSRAKSIAQKEGERLDFTLVGGGFVKERDLAWAYGQFLDRPVLSGDRYPEEPVAATWLRPCFLRQARVCPLSLEGGTLVVAIVDGLDEFTPTALSAASGLPVVVNIAVPLELDAAINRLYPEDGADATNKADFDAVYLQDDVERLRDLGSDSPVIKLVNRIIGRAVETGASDVHIELLETKVRVRNRYDGILQDVDSPPLSDGPAIVSRLKLMGRMDISERRLPQDGRIKLAVRGTSVDLRISTIPSTCGESVALRILDRGAVIFDYAQLGFPPDLAQAWVGSLNHSGGVLLVTGPTGSGKTTTLYTSLSSIDCDTRRVITIEDPVEIRLEKVSQMQTKSQIGASFAALLRATLRQDPDIIMVGEVRDLETAQTAMQAAATGHLVLSTLHTNSAISAITRLRNMGVEGYLMSSLLRGVIGQRLVRRLCPDCKQPDDIIPGCSDTPNFAERLAKGGRLFKAVGCQHCRQTGFKGRKAIVELLIPCREMQELIASEAGDTELWEVAHSHGFVPMFERGLDYALQGETTIAEVKRVLT
jgi:general secretion pathway protein E